MCDHLVSVIVPVYNTDRYLKKCIESVLNQSYKEIEVLLVDDKSTDDSLKIIRNYATSDTRIRLIENEVNLGNGKSRNKAIEMATGRWVMFVDSDDYLEPNAVEELVRLASESESDVILSGYNLISFQDGETDKVKKKRTMLPALTLTDHDNVMLRFLLQRDGLFGQPWIYFVARKLLTEHADIRFDESGRHFEDVIYSARLLYYQQRIAVLKRPVYNYVYRIGSITKSWSRKTIESKFHAITSVRDFLKEKGDFQKYKEAYGVYLVCSGFIKSFYDYVYMGRNDDEIEDFLYKISQSSFVKQYDVRKMKTISRDMLVRQQGSFDLKESQSMAKALNLAFFPTLRYAQFLYKIKLFFHPELKKSSI